MYAKRNLLCNGRVFKVLQPTPKEASIFHHIFLEFSLGIWMPAAKSLALLAQWNVDPLWASSGAIERLLLTPFRFRPSRGQLVKRECPGTRLECAQLLNKNKRVKGRQTRGNVGLVYFVYTNPRTWRPENGDVPTEQNACFVYFLR